MHEHSNLGENQVLPANPNQAPVTAGQFLKQARLKAGVHLAVLSVNLKVPVRQLEALEADQYLTNQSPVFVRGLASSVCRQLRIDPAPVLALLPHASSYSETSTPARHIDVAPAELGVMRPSSERLPVKALLAALAMALLIVGLIWLPGPSQWAWLAKMTSPVNVTDPVPTLQAPISLPDLVPLVPAASGEASLGGGSITVSSAPPLNPGAPTSIPVVDVPEPGKVSLSASKMVAYDWVFSAIAESWLEVRDGQNQVLWSGILKPGESSRFQAPLPVSVVVGRADALQVTFKGRAFDLKPHSKMNVARFEVKP